MAEFHPLRPLPIWSLFARTPFCRSQTFPAHVLRVHLHGLDPDSDIRSQNEPHDPIAPRRLTEVQRLLLHRQGYTKSDPADFLIEDHEIQQLQVRDGKMVPRGDRTPSTEGLVDFWCEPVCRRTVGRGREGYLAQSTCCLFPGSGVFWDTEERGRERGFERWEEERSEVEFGTHLVDRW